jgi:hypothetical protein
MWNLWKGVCGLEIFLFCFWGEVFGLWIFFRGFFYVHFIWFGGHSGGVTPGLVSIPEVKSSCVFGCTVG